MNPTFQDLSEEPSSAGLPPLDRATDNLSESMPPFAQQWCHNGVVLLPEFMPDALMDRYTALRAKIARPGGWKSPVPYMHYDQIKDICLYRPLSRVLEALIDTPMGLHLNLTGWISTERTWHQDDYLNPDFVMAHYLAVWIVLEDVDPRSGPFEYVPGSHKWPLLRREKVAKYMEPGAINTADWPTRAEAFVTPACEEEIKRRGAKVEQFLGRRGDVLIWHGRLLHQGSKPRVPGTLRKSLIAHYSAINKRPDMPAPMVYENGPSRGHYFPIAMSLEPWEIA